MDPALDVSTLGYASDRAADKEQEMPRNLSVSRYRHMLLRWKG